MQAIKFDTHTYVKELTGAGVTPEVAEIHAMTVAHAFGMFIDGVVTKDYLDATLDARFAAQDAKIEKRFVQQDAKFEKRFAAIDQRFVDLEMKFDKRFAAIDQRFVEQDLKFEKRFSAIETELGSVKTSVGSLSRQMYLLMGGVFIPLLLKIPELLQFT